MNFVRNPMEFIENHHNFGKFENDDFSIEKLFFRSRQTYTDAEFDRESIFGSFRTLRARLAAQKLNTTQFIHPGISKVPTLAGSE